MKHIFFSLCVSSKEGYSEIDKMSEIIKKYVGNLPTKNYIFGDV